MQSPIPLLLNNFFNELPVRIFADQGQPIFYAKDIAIILGIKDIKEIVRNFDPIEYISAYDCVKRGLNKILLSEPTDKIPLFLTEFGVYRLLMTTTSELSERFRSSVYEALYKIRNVGIYSVQKYDRTIKISPPENLDALVDLRREQREFIGATDIKVVPETIGHIYIIGGGRVLRDGVYKCGKTKGDINNLRKRYKTYFGRDANVIRLYRINNYSAAERLLLERTKEFAIDEISEIVEMDLDALFAIYDDVVAQVGGQHIEYELELQPSSDALKN